MQGLDDLVLFASVANEGGFSGAARALGIPKSSVSQRVANLERRLGVRLLQRSTRAVNMTAIGQAFFKSCLMVTDAAKSALDLAAHARIHPGGKLRISSPVGIAYRFLSPVLAKFLLTHPDVRIDLELTNRHVDVIGEGYDIVLRSQAIMDDSDLVVRKFGETTQVLVVSPIYLNSHGVIDSLDSLRRCAAIGPQSDWCLLDPDGRFLDIEYTSALLTDDLFLLRKMALSGVGVAKLPLNFCTEELRNGRLQIVLPDYKLRVHQLHAVFPSRRGMLPTVRAFIDALAKEIPSISARP
jgi:DNA-binding transcriptional LysR family regulator